MANNQGEHGSVPKTVVDGFDSHIGHMIIKFIYSKEISFANNWKI